MIPKFGLGISWMGERSKVLRDDCIWDDGYHQGVERGAKNCVFFATGLRREWGMLVGALPRMTDANYMIHITESELEKLVGEDAGSISKTK